MLARRRPHLIQKLVMISGGAPTPLAPQPGIFSMPICALRCLKPIVNRGFYRYGVHFLKLYVVFSCKSPFCLLMVLVPLCNAIKFMAILFIYGAICLNNLRPVNCGSIVYSTEYMHGFYYCWQLLQLMIISLIVIT